MGALLQILLRVLPAPSHDSDTEVEVEAHYACACCGDVRVDENAHENKDPHDNCSGMGGQP
jgi:hypothetical protein